MRFRELSLSYTRAERLRRPVPPRPQPRRSRRAVRNIGMIWTKYTGVDPEAFGTTGDAPSEFQAFAPPTYFSFRLNLGF